MNSALLLLLGAVASSVSADTLYKSFDFSSRNAVNNEWNVLTWGPGVVNNELQNYTTSTDNVYTQNGALNIRTKKSGNGYTSGRLESKQTFSPLNFSTKKMRIVFVASVPAYEGAWPALWMNGISSTYGNWPKTGEIDMMEWVWSLGTHTQSSLHWKSGNDWGQADLDYNGYQDIQATHTYRVDVSAITGNEYIQFSIDDHWYPNVYASTWQSTFQPDVPCNGPEATRCSGLAPFDNQMTLIMNTAVGGDWGGVNVDNYDAFDGNGVVMTIQKAEVWELSP